MTARPAPRRTSACASASGGGAAARRAQTPLRRARTTTTRATTTRAAEPTPRGGLLQVQEEAGLAPLGADPVLTGFSYKWDFLSSLECELRSRPRTTSLCLFG